MIEPIVGQASTRSGSIAVRATEDGLLVAVRIDPRELRFGGADLAATILEQSRRAAEFARADRRRLLAEAGVPPDVLDRLGLSSSVEEADDTAPASWLRPV